MTLLDRPHTGTPRGARDGAMDLVRAASLVVVVLLHAFMAGISVVDGQITVTNVIEGQAWFGPVSWIVQIMPLFFIVGGFAGAAQWRRLRARGVSAPEFARRRVFRLVVPAVLAFALVGTGLAIAVIAGVSPDLVAELGFRMSQPLWFLGVFIGATTLVPALLACHERAPRVTLAALGTAVVTVDLISVVPGLEGFGFLNLAFVWLAIQQLGFWWADGRITALRRRRLVGGAAGALAVLGALTISGAYSPDMFVNLNPPTLCLVILGVAQLFLLALVAPALRRIAARPRIARAVTAVGERSMTIYLWHMPAIVALGGILFAAGATFPDPLGPIWWTTRPVWLIGAVAATALLVGVTARAERIPLHAGPVVGRARTLLAVTIAMGGVVIVLLTGYGPVAALAGAAALLLALGLLRTVRANGAQAPLGATSPAS